MDEKRVEYTAKYVLNSDSDIDLVELWKMPRIFWEGPDKTSGGRCADKLNVIQGFIVCV